MLRKVGIRPNNPLQPITETPESEPVPEHDPVPVAGAQDNPGTVKTLTEYCNKLDGKLPSGKTPYKLNKNKANIPNKNKEGSIKKEKETSFFPNYLENGPANHIIS